MSTKHTTSISPGMDIELRYRHNGQVNILDVEIDQIGPVGHHRNDRNPSDSHDLVTVTFWVKKHSTKQL